jgi:hypothetical protein
VNLEKAPKGQLGKLDFQKMKPLILSHPNTTYWRLGEPMAMAWNIGKKYEAKRK